MPRNWPPGAPALQWIAENGATGLWNTIRASHHGALFHRSIRVHDPLGMQPDLAAA